VVDSKPSPWRPLVGLLAFRFRGYRRGLMAPAVSSASTLRSLMGTCSLAAIASLGWLEVGRGGCLSARARMESLHALMGCILCACTVACCRGEWNGAHTHTHGCIRLSQNSPKCWRPPLPFKRSTFHAGHTQWIHLNRPRPGAHGTGGCRQGVAAIPPSVNAHARLALSTPSHAPIAGQACGAWGVSANVWCRRGRSAVDGECPEGALLTACTHARAHGSCLPARSPHPNACRCTATGLVQPLVCN